MKIAIDIDGVVAGGKYDEWDWKDRLTYDKIPPMEGKVGDAIATIHNMGNDAYYCTGRSRDLHLATHLWFDKHAIPKLPVYYCSGQVNKPAWLSLLQPDMIVDDNPNVLKGVFESGYYGLPERDGWRPKLVLVYDPSFHQWEMPWKQGIPSYITVIKSITELPSLL